MIEGDLTKSQLDRLGSRLRNENAPSDQDLVLLNSYRERFVGVNDSVIRTLASVSAFPVESRHKSVPSIVAKLRRRQPARLLAIQDIAGCRIIVPDAVDQDELVTDIAERFPNCIIDDKRTKPTYGYRAVHIVVSRPLPYEIQVRTSMEHAWAQLSERLADRYGFDLKYGGGPPVVRDALIAYSEFTAMLARATPSRGKVDEEAVTAVLAWSTRIGSIMEALRIE
jgi:GTP pyrophosphokinase